MNRKRIIIRLIVTILAAFSGCRKEATSTKWDGKVGMKEREIQECLNLITNWQSHFEIRYVKRHPFLNKLNHAIAHETDNDQYKKYMGQYIDVAFSIPIDASDSGLRLQQLDSFCTVTESVMSCAESHGDWNTYWVVGLRRLECIQAEMLKLKARFPDGGPQLENDVPCLGRGGWDNCYGVVNNEYKYSVRNLSRLITNFLMTHVLTYEKWVEYHSRLEKIVGHEVPIKEIMFKLWSEKEAKTSGNKTQVVSGKDSEQEVKAK
jgi:hypothetical protein